MPNNNALPYEIIASESTLYAAVVGTAFPLIDAVPAVDWVKIGTLGAKNMKDDGVTFEDTQEISEFRALGGTLPRKTFRTSESEKIKLVLVDMTLEQIKIALNGNTITTVAPGGEAGYKKIGLSRGVAIANYALLVRFPSPYMANGNAQWEFPLTQQTGSPSLVLMRKEPIGVAIEFTVLEDPNAASDDEAGGRYIAQTAVAIS